MNAYADSLLVQAKVQLANRYIETVAVQIAKLFNGDPSQVTPTFFLNEPNLPKINFTGHFNV